MNRKSIDRSFQPLYGHPCSGLHYDRNLNLSMNFGKPSLHVREPFSTDSKSESVRRLAARRRITVRGEWWLWIYCCYWRLSSGDQELATGSSSFRRIEQANAQLEGQQLVSVAVAPETGATRFAFDLGCVLHCRRFERDTDAELWMLYKPRGHVLSVHGNGTFSHQRATEVKKLFQPIEGIVRSEDLQPDPTNDRPSNLTICCVCCHCLLAPVWCSLAAEVWVLWGGDFWYRRLPRRTHVRGRNNVGFDCA